MPSIKELYEKLQDVKIDADSINVNTDGLESLLATTQADIALIKADIANGVLCDVRDGSGNAITSTVFGSARRLDVNLSSAGTVGSTAPTSANLYGGSDGTNLRAVSVDSSGRPNVNVNGTVPVSGTFWQSTQPVSGSVTALSSTGNITTRSSTITTGGTSQQVAASNSSRKYFVIQNISDTAMYLGIGYTPTTTTGLLLSANGGGIVFETSFIPTQAINVLCATTGKAFVAWEG